ncbi:hypothetical protein BDZ97DRAFT_1899971 [Flammula alnicola]|nr:hypothetical protein BDZ97DRAFT_1899971 [Flammula alnicola]
MADAEEKARLLSILESHGQSFLSSFPILGNDSRKRKSNTGVALSSKKARREEVSDNEQEEEEWFGIGKNLPSDQDSEDDEDEENGSGSDFEHTDDEFTTENAASNVVVVFSDPGPKKSTTVDHVSKAQMKAFMSSKISKLTSTSQDTTTVKNQADEEEDRTNAQNDALLHKLVHTKLLSGSLSTELDLSPAHRRKALAGRVLELTGGAKLGKGEKLVRDAEKNKAAKRVREGLAHKQKERSKQELEEAKNLGNYHPTLKKVFEASSGPTTRKREKGLKMGVGKFSNGSLRLTRDDVNMVMAGHKEGSSSRGRGRGRGRGKPGKRK